MNEEVISAAGEPAATSTTSPVSQTEGKKVPVDVLHLNDIPGAMDKMGWTVSAKMMRRWFANTPAFEMPEHIRSGEGVDYLTLPASQIDDQVIKMDWLLGFERAQQVFDQLVNNWTTTRGISLLKRRLANAGWAPEKSVQIGYGMNSARQLDMFAQVNAKSFGDYAETFDDLYGAIFKATLKVAVVGKTYRSTQSKQDIFEVERLGVYVRDTYDFNSGWFTDTAAGLGIWSRHRLLSKAEMIEYRANQLTPAGWAMNYAKYRGFVAVKNSDFRRWQDKNRSGGDFFVFSDVKWVQSSVDHIVV